MAGVAGVAGVAVGLSLQPEAEFLDRTAALLDAVDYVELAPETLWRADGDAYVDNGYVDVIAGLVADSGVFVVGHGVGLSLGAVADDPARVARWRTALARNQARFGFRWLSDHGGLTTTAGAQLALPVAVPSTPARVHATRKKLALLAEICGGPALAEVSAWPFFAGSSDTVAVGYRAIACGVDDGGDIDVDAGLLLDVHNVWTMAQNLGFDADAFVDALPLGRVRSIHVSGGTMSAPGFLSGGRRVRLDSHDDAVPDAVFDLLARVVPRCPRLLGITLERMEGTVRSDDDVDVLARELAVIDAIAATHVNDDVNDDDNDDDNGAVTRVTAAALSDRDIDDDVYVDALRAADPVAALRAVWPNVDAAGVETAALLITKLRFERVVNGDVDAVADFHHDPAGFVARFARYHAAVRPTALDPVEEAKQFRAFVSRAP